MNSFEYLPGKATSTSGASFITCLDHCGFSSLVPGELIAIQNTWYKVAQSFMGDDVVLPLATATDASVPSVYTGGSDATFVVSRWARSYEYQVTFINALTSSSGQPLPLGGLKHGLYHSH